jgi:predicted metal-dependent phosphoesterase TrpH
MMQMQECVENLNNDNLEIRLEALRKLMEGIEKGILKKPIKKGHVNNHIHTTYSFSPYYPTKALWMAYNAGLTTAGIMDHDSIAGAREFIEAGKIIGIATTIGVECRVDFSKTPLNGRQINNPDQKSIAYIALHGIPHTQIDTVKEFFTPYTRERNKRNRQMTEKINDIVKPFGVYIDFDEDVIPISRSHEGGSITERHLLFALSKKLIERYGKGKKLVDFLKDDLKLPIKPRLEMYLLDTENDFYEYDLLGVLKSDMVSKFYIDATDECPDVKDVIDFSKSIGAISAYAYLGDVGDSVTGDKKTQKFEDDYLELLFDVIRDLGFNAVTYMPSRNTMAQLKRVKDLCRKFGFFEISGEDINSPRQSFVCDALQKEEFKNLVDSTWALIGHEKAATLDISNGMFSNKTIEKYPDLEQRIQVYKDLGINE